MPLEVLVIRGEEDVVVERRHGCMNLDACVGEMDCDVMWLYSLIDPVK